MNEFLELDDHINPNMTIYSAGRDVMRTRKGDWFDKYLLKSLDEFFCPGRPITDLTSLTERPMTRLSGKNFVRSGGSS